MVYIYGEKELVDLLQHPLVNPRIDRGIWAGISGGTQIDYALHVVDTAVNAHPEVIEIKDKYVHFKSLNPSRYGSQVKVDYSQQKNQFYSARGSMNS